MWQKGHRHEATSEKCGLMLAARDDGGSTDLWLVHGPCYTRSTLPPITWQLPLAEVMVFPCCVLPTGPTCRDVRGPLKADVGDLNWECSVYDVLTNTKTFSHTEIAPCGRNGGKVG